MLVLNASQTAAMLDSIVERFGADHQNIGQCIYFKQVGYRMEAVCIVGQVLADLGILRAANIAETENCNDGDRGALDNFAACVTDSSLWDNIERFGVKFTEGAKVLLREAQNQQDSDVAWGEAVVTAKRHVKAWEQKRIDLQVAQFRDSLMRDSETLGLIVPDDDSQVEAHNTHEGRVQKVLADAETLRHIYEQRKIYAIKRLREQTGCGLLEAKNAVEDYRVQPTADNMYDPQF